MSKPNSASTSNASLDKLAEQVNANDETQGAAIAAGEASSSPEVTRTKSWRDRIPVHPAADFFPMMSDDELLALGKDIKENGFRESITMFKAKLEEDGPWMLLDGRNRLDAIERVVEDPEERKELLEFAFRENPRLLIGGDIDPAALVISLNAHRCHLTSGQKCELIAKLLKQDPEQPDRYVAELVKVDHKTVAEVRAEAEARGEIPRVGWVTRFMRAFYAQPNDTLVYLQTMLRGERETSLGDISREKRISLAHGFLTVLNVGLDELREQNCGNTSNIAPSRASQATQVKGG
jgi:hypothetical protein